MTATTTHRRRVPALPTLDEADLIGAVIEVVRELRPQAPETVPPKQFDAFVRNDATAALPRFLGVPAARSVRRRLAGLDWYGLLALLLDPSRDSGHQLSLRRRLEWRSVTQDECVGALRVVASRLGLASLRPHEYVAERQRLLDGDGRAWLHGTDMRRNLPTVSQVEHAFDADGKPDWDGALVAAGLQERGPTGGRPGIPLAQAIEMFLTDVGCLPWAETALLQTGTAKGISLPRATNSISDPIARVREDRARRGLWTPPRPPGRGARPPIEVDAMTDPPVARRERTKWGDLDALIEGMMAAYDIATARGERTLTRRLHVELAKEHRGVIPAPAVVDRRAALHGKTAAWVRAEATRRRRAVRAGTSRALSTSI